MVEKPHTERTYRECNSLTCPVAEKLPLLTERDVIVPEGFRYELNTLWGPVIVRDDPPAFFRLTDRSFEYLNARDGYNNKFRLEIDRRVDARKTRDPKVAVVDLGGGPRSVCADGIVDEYGPENVQAFNVDWCLAKDSCRAYPEGRRAQAIRGDIARLPFPDNSVDVFQSFQVLEFILNEYGGDRERYFQILSEVARALKLGGVAFLDDSYLCRYSPLSDMHTWFLQNFGVFCSTAYREQGVDGRMFTIGFPTPFLRMEKHYEMRARGRSEERTPVWSN